MGNFWGGSSLFSGAKGGFLYTANCGCAILQGLVIFELSGSMGMDKNGNDISQCHDREMQGGTLAEAYGLPLV